jgi:hypothetical protein
LAWRADPSDELEELARASLDPAVVPGSDVREGSWTLVARTLWPDSAGVLLLTRIGPSALGWFGAGFAVHANGWSLEVQQSDEWLSPELVRPTDDDVWWLSDITGGVSTQHVLTVLVAGHAAAAVASVEATCGPVTRAVAPAPAFGAFVVALRLEAANEMTLVARDGAGRAVAEHVIRPPG